MKKKRTILAGILRVLLPPLCVAALLLILASALDSVAAGQSEEHLRQLEEALRRACVACYAAEGVYPPDLDYLKERYGIQIDEDRYNVHYEVFASNLMPSITVWEASP